MTTTLNHSLFEPECRAAIDGVRAALLELYAQVGADPAGPQEVARRFGVNKTLAWNVSKVMTAADPLSSMSNLPGASAFQSLLRAIERGGADPVLVARAQEAIGTLDATVERHVGDRATLELIVDGLSPGRSDHLDTSRKLAFRGNSGLLGVQAKTRVMTVVMAPNDADPSLIDVAIVRGYIGVRRLRAGVQWPIFQIRGWGFGTNMMTDERWRPLDSGADHAPALPLLRDFSSVDADEIEERRTPAGVDYLLAPGPIGNCGAVDCYIGDMGRGVASRYRADDGYTGEFGATIAVPTEQLLFDLIVDERLDFALDAKVVTLLGLFADPTANAIPDAALPLEISQPVMPLAGQPPVVATSGVPCYRDIVKFVYARMGWDAKNFRGCRLDLSYPPLGSTVLLRFELPKPPAA